MNPILSAPVMGVKKLWSFVWIISAILNVYELLTAVEEWKRNDLVASVRVGRSGRSNKYLHIAHDVIITCCRVLFNMPSKLSNKWE